MARSVHVLSLMNLTEAQLQKLRDVSPDVVVEQSTGTPEEALTPDTEILYMLFGSFAMQKAPHLRWIQLYSAGVNQFHDAPVWQSDVTITTANGVHSIQIAEHVIMSLLALGHRLPTGLQLQERHEWNRDPFDPTPFMPRELRGATLGILGYGAIGREIGRLASSFGMRVLATKRAGRPAAFDGWTPAGTGDPDGSIPERYYTTDELADLLPQCDAVVLSLPLNKATEHIIGREQLAQMRPHSFLINIGRGGLVDQEALIEALESEHLQGAALDVTDPEPLPADDPLWRAKNVIITPHISGLSTHYDDRAVELFAENLRRYLNHEEMLNVVQRKLGY